MIYRLALGQGAIHRCCKHPMGVIGIENMARDEYHKYETRNRLRSRTSYDPMYFPAACCPEHGQLYLTKTTYKLAGSMGLPGLGLLSLNRQTRSEALPIFYGENMFAFSSTASVRPFLKDRPNAARQNIHNIELFLNLAYFDGKHGERQREWIKVFRYLQHHLNLKTVNVIVNDITLHFMVPARFEGRDKEWLRALAQIKDLDRVTLDWQFGGREDYIDSLAEESDLDDDDLDLEMEMLEDWITEIEGEYESYLHSRMLKKKQDSLDCWLGSHVCNARCQEISKGRRAVKRGLPRSATHGEWRVPEVDLDALYDSNDPDDPSDEDYSDTDDSDDATEEGGALVVVDRAEWREMVKRRAERCESKDE